MEGKGKMKRTRGRSEDSSEGGVRKLAGAYPLIMQGERGGEWGKKKTSLTRRWGKKQEPKRTSMTSKRNAEKKGHLVKSNR